MHCNIIVFMNIGPHINLIIKFHWEKQQEIVIIIIRVFVIYLLKVPFDFLSKLLHKFFFFKKDRIL